MGIDESTASLVVLAREGDAAASEALVRRHLRAAYTVALSVTGNPSDAEDLAQEGIMVAFEQLDTCRDPARFPGWLLQIVRNRARNALEKRRVRDCYAQRIRAEATPPVSMPDDQRSERRERLLKALARLTPRQREVVLLHDLHGYTHVEVAAALSISEVSSRQHLFKGRQMLRELLPDDGFRSEVGHDER